ncbi:hypothetical protein XENOCAPTIV_013321, partial [Xenoophorus captivus]
MPFCSQFIPMNVIDHPKHGSIIYHPSILPLHRGASAINWTLIHGDKKAGFTVFWADDGLDTGPILLQRECAIETTDTVDTLYHRFLFPEGIKAMVTYWSFSRTLLLVEEVKQECAGVQLQNEDVYMATTFQDFIQMFVRKLRGEDQEEELVIDYATKEVNNMTVNMPHQCFIDGKFEDAENGKTYNTINPTDGSVICKVSYASVGDVDRAVAAAKEAFDNGPWGRMNPRDRGSGMVGQRLSDHPDIRKLGFTGSTPIGKQIMKRLEGKKGGTSFSFRTQMVFDTPDLEVSPTTLH